MIEKKQLVCNSIHPSLWKGLQIFSKDEVEGKLAIHISDNPNIKKFIPRISDRGLKNEDAKVPRVSVSLSVVDAISGHSSTEKMFTDSHWFNGMFAIYAIDYEMIVKPRRSLVPDTHYTNEYWLTSYNPDTMEYGAKLTGKFFYESIVIHRLNKKKIYTFYMLVNEDDKVMLDSDTMLKEGAYRISATVDTGMDKDNYRPNEPMAIDSLESITKAEFLEKKNGNVFSLETIGYNAALNW